MRKKSETQKHNHMKRKFSSAIIVLAFLLGTVYFAGCGGRSNDQGIPNDPGTNGSYYSEDKEKNVTEGNEETDQSKSEEPSAQKSAKDNNDNPSTASTGSQSTDLTDNDKIPVEKDETKMIKTAEISMQVKDYKKTRTDILNLAKSSGAYIASENQVNNSYNIENDIEIRIKPSGFDSLIEKLLDVAAFVDYNKITADDVTEEYVDAEARLKAKQDVEIQYKEILKKASTISEIMSVQEKINQIQEEIDAYQAKIKFMDDKVSYSTIKLHFYEKLEEIPAPESGFSHRVGKAFKTGWHGLQMFFIGFIYLWPLWLIALIALYLVFFFIKRARRRRMIKKQ